MLQTSSGLVRNLSGNTMCAVQEIQPGWIPTIHPYYTVEGIRQYDSTTHFHDKNPKKREDIHFYLIEHIRRDLLHPILQSNTDIQYDKQQ